MAMLATAAAPATAQPLPRGHIEIVLEVIPLSAGDQNEVAPEPGSAISSPASYDQVLWAIAWKCVFTGWALIKVNWSCKLARTQAHGGGTLSGPKTGSFTGGWANPGPWYYATAPMDVCVYAFANYSAYPAVSDSDDMCWVP
jgi:hypothetical protein